MPTEDNLREVRREIERIKDRIDDISHIQALQVRALGDVRELVLQYFSGPGGPNKARIYIAADGETSVSEIAEKVRVDQAHVTRKCKEMYDLGILGWEAQGSTKLYHKTVIERALHISREVRRIADGS